MEKQVDEDHQLVQIIIILLQVNQVVQKPFDQGNRKKIVSQEKNNT